MLETHHDSGSHTETVFSGVPSYLRTHSLAHDAEGNPAVLYGQGDLNGSNIAFTPDLTALAIHWRQGFG